MKDSIDTKEFFKRGPDYIIDSNEDGSFSFNYLSNGDYRIVGIDRAKASSNIDPKFSIYGLPSFDIIKIDSAATKIKNVRILMPDNPKLAKIVSAKWINNQTGELTFDTPINQNINLISVDIDIDGRKFQASTFEDYKKNNILHFFLKDSIKSGVGCLLYTSDAADE